MAHARLDDISFSYPVYDASGRSLKVSLARSFAGSKVAQLRGSVLVEALKNVSIDLEEGDRLGLIGRNGSGKSTLLRVFAGLAHPESGTVDISGRIVPLIEKGLGVNPELSGRANVELPLRLLGATTQEVREALEEIPEFCGLGEFYNLPVRTYSEGMRARLMFAICTAVQADLLVLDEWLGAGDINFLHQAEQRMAQLIGRTKIVVLASHSLDLLRTACTKVAWLDRGQMVMQGAPGPVIDAYINHMQAETTYAMAAE